MNGELYYYTLQLVIQKNRNRDVFLVAMDKIDWYMQSRLSQAFE